MELSIRSQNKEVLTKYNCLGLEEQPEGKYSIVNHMGLEFYQYLGTYEYERALEVLDEIQKLLEPKVIVKANTGVAKSLYENVFQEVEIYSQESLNSSRIYQMPKD